MLFGRRFWAAILGVIFTYFSAALLGPIGLGFLALLRMIPSFATIINFGWISAACREILPLLALGQEKQSYHLRNVAYTGELGVGIFWIIGVLIYAFSASDLSVKVGVLIAAVSIGISLFSRLMVNDMVVEKDFKIQARVGVLTATLNFVLGLAGAWLWGALGLFAAITLVQLIEVGIYWRLRGFSLTCRWDSRELLRLTRIGIPLALLTLFGSLMGVNLWIERSIIGIQGGLELLGLFVFSISICNQMENFLWEFLVSYQSHFWATLAKPHKKEELFHLVRKPSIILAYIAAGLGVLVIVALPPCISLFLAKYRPMQQTLWIFMLAGMISSLACVPAILLRSAYADEQNYFLFSRAISSALYAAFLWVLVGKFQFGLVGAALAALLLQISVVIFTLAKAYPFYIGNWAIFRRFIYDQLMPISFVIGTYLCCNWLFIKNGLFRSNTELLNNLLVSLITLALSGVFLIVSLERKTEIFSELFRLAKSRSLASNAPV